MNQINNEYYPKVMPFTEIIIRFTGFTKKPADVMCYLKLKYLTKKLNMTYPQFFINSDFSRYGILTCYDCETILDDSVEQKNKIKAICSELIKYGIKNKSIPMIELITYREEKNIYGFKLEHNKLEDYLKNKAINLEDLNIEEIILNEKSLEESR